MMKLFNIIQNKIDSLINFFGILSSFLIPILILIISISVVMRYFFSLGFTWLQDLYIWTHSSIILLGIAYTLKFDSHVRIDLLYRNASKNYKKVINLMGSLLFSIPFCLLLIAKGYPFFERSFLLNESSKETGGLPAIYIVKFLILVLGISLFIQVINGILKILLKKNGNN